MTDLFTINHLPTVSTLNQTPEGLAAKAFLAGAGLTLQDRLATAVLLEWAVDNLAADRGWAKAVRQAVDLAEGSDPEALHQAILPTGFLEAKTRTDAGRLMLQRVVDLIPPGTQPA